jgi:hypothetical protein
MANTNDLRLSKKEGVEEALSIARAVLRPTIQSASTLKMYEKKFGELGLTELVEALSEQTDMAVSDNSDRAVAMLTAQAHTLDAIFNNLAQRAALNLGEYLGTVETYLKLAMRAQSQCRSTWEAVSAIKHPPVAGYVKQANIAHGPQQVNNSPPPEGGASRTGENENAQNKLLEKTDGKPLDKGTTGAAGRTDQDMATVGAVDRAKD